MPNVSSLMKLADGAPQILQAQSQDWCKNPRKN